MSQFLFDKLQQGMRVRIQMQFRERLLNTTTGIPAVTRSLLRARRTSGPPNFGNSMSNRIKSGICS